MRSFLLATLEPTRLVALRRPALRGLPTLRPLRLVYLRVYFFRTLAPLAHFLAASLSNLVTPALLPGRLPLIIRPTHN